MWILVYLQHIPVRGVVFVKAEEGVALDSVVGFFLLCMCVFTCMFSRGAFLRYLLHVCAVLVE